MEELSARVIETLTSLSGVKALTGLSIANVEHPDPSKEIQLCEDMSEEVYPFVDSILEVLSKSHATYLDLLRDLMTLSGVSPDFMKKLHLLEVTGRVERVRHLKAACKYTQRLLELIAGNPGITFLDFDGVLDPLFPANSDITLMGLGADGRKLLIFIDFTFTTANQEKMMSMMQSVEAFAKSHGISCYGAVLEFEQTFVSKEELKEAYGPEDFLGENLLTVSEKAIDNLSLSILRSSEQEVHDFLKTLSSVMDPLLDSYVTRSIDLPNDQDTLTKELADLYSYIESMMTSLERDVLISIEHANPRSPAVLERLISVASKRGLPVAAKFLSIPYETCHPGKIRPAFRSPIPLLCPERDMRDALFKKASVHDPFFLTMRLALEDDSEDSYKKGKFIFETGKTSSCPDSWLENFSRPQDLRMSFPNGVISAYRRPVYYKKITNSEGKEVDELVFEPGACILVNPAYTRDSAFTKFLLRRTPDHPSPEKTADGRPEDEKEFFSKSMHSYFETLGILTPSEDEASSRAKATFSSLDKVDLLMLNLGPQNLNTAFHESRTITDNPVMDYLDERYHSSRGMSSAMSAFRKPNYATIISSSQYCSWTLMYVNSPVTNFKTTWLRKLVLTTDKYSSLSELSLNRMSLELEPQAEHVVDLDGHHPLNIFSNFSGNEVIATSSKFHSIDKNQLEWDLMALPRAIMKLTAMYEHRRELYKSPAFFTPSDPVYPAEGRCFGRAEAVAQALTFLHNSQQMSVIYEATRYLHQAVSSLDCDYAGVLNKLKGVRVKTYVEAAGFYNMAVPYTLSVLRRAAVGLNPLKSRTKEVKVLLGGLLSSTSDPTFAVGLYSISSQLNDTKFNRVPAEAACVEAVWKANVELQKCLLSMPEEYAGLPKEVAYEWGINGLDAEGFTLTDYALSLSENLESITSFHDKILLAPRKQQYISSSLVELYSYLKLRFEIGKISSVSTLLARDYTSQFTTRGAHVSSDFKAGVRTKSVRKASALLSMTGAMLTPKSEHYDEDGSMKTSELQGNLAEAVRASPLLQPKMDLFNLYLHMQTGKLDSFPMIQLSQKDARGKDREISTLHVVYGMRNIICEELASPLSRATPEDIILEENKEKVISGFVTSSSIGKKEAAALSNMLAFINQDKSAFGPNKKLSSFLCYACALAPDLATYSFLRDTFLMGKSKKVRYPVELLKQSLGKVRPAVGSEFPDSNFDFGTKFDPRSKTSRTMQQISEQFLSGNSNGPRGTDFAVVPEGMPGQGIMGISSSLQHSAVLRLFGEVLERVTGWVTKAVVTSDDSMTILIFPQSDSTEVRKRFRNINNRFLALAGLIDNDSKFSSTFDKGEMNSLFFVRDMPCMPIEKFAMAYSKLTTSADFPQDAMKAASSAGDLCRKGATFFLSSTLGAVNLMQALDAHRLWQVYVDERTKGLASIASNPVQAFGMPDISPVLQILSPLGSYFKPSDSDFEANINLHAAWATKHFLQTPSIETFQGDADLSANPLASKLTDKNLGSISYVKPLSYWGIAGLRGMLRRPKGTLRLAREISPQIISLRDKGAARYLSGPFALGGLISTVLDSLARPIDRGDGDKPAYLQHADLAHARDREFLELNPTSPLARILKKAKLSRKGLTEALQAPGLADNLRKLHLASVLNTDLETGTGSEIFEAIRNELSFSFKVAASSSQISVELSNDNVVVSEHLIESGPLPPYRYKVTKMGAQRGVGMSKEDIMRLLFSRTCAASEWERLPLSERRAHYPDRPNGTSSLTDALSMASNSAERLHAVLNPSNQLVTRLPDGIHSRRDLVINWIHGNTMLGLKGRMLTNYMVFQEVDGLVGSGREKATLSALNPLVGAHLMQEAAIFMAASPKARASTVTVPLIAKEAESTYWAFSDSREPRLKRQLTRFNLVPAVTELSFMKKPAVVDRLTLVSLLEQLSGKGYFYVNQATERARVFNLSPSRKKGSQIFLVRSQLVNGPPTVYKYQHKFLVFPATAQEGEVTVPLMRVHESEAVFLKSLSFRPAQPGISTESVSIPVSYVTKAASSGKDLFTLVALAATEYIEARESLGFLSVKILSCNVEFPLAFLFTPSQLADASPKLGLRPSQLVLGEFCPKREDTFEGLAKKLSLLSLAATEMKVGSECFNLAKMITMQMASRSGDPRSASAALDRSLSAYVSSGMVKFSLLNSTLGLKHVLNDDLEEEEIAELYEPQGGMSWADMEEAEGNVIGNNLVPNSDLLRRGTPFALVDMFADVSEIRKMAMGCNDSWSKASLVASGICLGLLELKKTLPLQQMTVNLPSFSGSMRLDSLEEEEQTTGIYRELTKKRKLQFRSVFDQMQLDSTQAVQASKDAAMMEMALTVQALPQDEDVLALLLAHQQNSVQAPENPAFFFED